MPRAPQAIIASRLRDEFGLSDGYTDMSEVLKGNLDRLPIGGRLQVEHQLGVFSNVPLAPWRQLTGDLQIVRPNRPAAETAIVPAVRRRLVFQESRPC